MRVAWTLDRLRRRRRGREHGTGINQALEADETPPRAAKQHANTVRVIGLTLGANPAALARCVQTRRHRDTGSASVAFITPCPLEVSCGPSWRVARGPGVTEGHTLAPQDVHSSAKTRSVRLALAWPGPECPERVGPPRHTPPRRSQDCVDAQGQVRGGVPCPRVSTISKFARQRTGTVPNEERPTDPSSQRFLRAYFRSSSAFS